MSAAEHENGAPVESRSSVKLSRNAKGDTQFEIKVYVGDTAEQVATAREIAEQAYGDLAARYGA